MTPRDAPGATLETSLSEAALGELQPDGGTLGEINRIADQLCGAIDGNHDLRVACRSDDRTLQKLCISINFLLDTVRRSLAQAEAEAREARRNLAIIEGQRDEIRSLSTPLLQLRADVLLLPIIGALDEDRCERLTEQLLGAVAARHARYAIIDITGVTLVDSHAAAFIMRLASSVGLLGARCVLTGIRPAVAQSLVELDADFGRVIIARDLEQGLSLCLA